MRTIMVLIISVFSCFCLSRYHDFLELWGAKPFLCEYAYICMWRVFDYSKFI